MNSGIPLRAANLRVHNEKIILAEIYARHSAGLSQSELVELTGLKAPTIFRMFNSLSEQGLIEPVSEDTIAQNGKRGRKPVNFCVCREARYTIAVEFWAASLSIGVFDFWGGRIQSSIQNLSLDMTIDDIVALIASSIRSIVCMLGIDPCKILGVGIAAPGQVDLVTNRVVYYPRIAGMKDYPIVEKLQKLLNYTVILHNNCSSLSLGEFRYGNFDTGDSMFTFLLRSGVNGTFVDRNTIFVNSRQRTIETGHIPISTEGPQCSCGMQGCLQAYIRALDKDSSDNLLFEHLDTESEEGKVIIGQAAGYLHTAAKIIMKMLAPSSFLITACNEKVAAALSDDLERRACSPDAFGDRMPKIYHTAYNPIYAQRGISDLVLSRYFSEEIV